MERKKNVTDFEHASILFRGSMVVHDGVLQKRCHCMMLSRAPFVETQRHYSELLAIFATAFFTAQICLFIFFLHYLPPL